MHGNKFLPNASLLIVGVLIALGACGDVAEVSKPPTLDASLQAIADESGLEIIDVSVPFERFAKAPAKLQAVNEALEVGPPGVYVMRYSDDTLRQTLHVFVIHDEAQSYVKLTSTPGEDITETRFVIQDARYDEASTSLVLETPASAVKLTPQDVTSAGA